MTPSGPHMRGRSPGPCSPAASARPRLHSVPTVPWLPPLAPARMSPRCPLPQKPPPGPGPPSHGPSPRQPPLQARAPELPALHPAPAASTPAPAPPQSPKPDTHPQPVFATALPGYREHWSEHPKAIWEPLSKVPSPAGPRLQCEEGGGQSPCSPPPPAAAAPPPHAWVLRRTVKSNGFVEIQFTCHKVHPLNVYNSFV